jgi:hypothetical protein
MKSVTIKALCGGGKEVTETAWKPCFCGVRPQEYIYGDHPTAGTFKDGLQVEQNAA